MQAKNKGLSYCRVAFVLRVANVALAYTRDTAELLISFEKVHLQGMW
jgi:hypothetical protein